MVYEPKIIAFLCTWCSYTGADTAGIARLKSPANIRAIRVPCSGRVAPEIIMRTFDQGADGVLVLGCHIGECHYDSGNHRTAKRLPVLQALMTFVGLGPERLRLDWVSASEGERFSRIVNEFTDTIRALGPVKWRVERDWRRAENTNVLDSSSYTTDLAPHLAIQAPIITQTIRDKAEELLSSGQVSCVIGYETGTHGRTRPAFIYDRDSVGRLVWNQDCTHNLTTYLRMALNPQTQKKGVPARPVAVVVKPCDSRAINVLMAENRFDRDKVFVIGVACDGMRESQHTNGDTAILQERCQQCGERLPAVYDFLVGEPPQVQPIPITMPRIAELEAIQPERRMEYWLSQFDRCIRCYACRQACPMCDCPTCLYERDDSLWVGMRIGLDEKRTFHLGRAFHLAGRCVDCHECENVCPMDIPISLLNGKLAQEMQSIFGHRAGIKSIPSPFVTMLNGEERLP
jgi:coenzyme F420-reducing hydrogenase delta subunit/ferredoxin